jgi:hypothetical protein
VPSSPAPAPSPPAPPPIATSPGANASAGPDLGAERSLLDRARAAFARDDYGASLAALGSHARRFPRGRLEEEREALTVKALVGAGQYDEARTRGARFRKRFSQSFLLPAVEEALRAIP